MLQPIYPPQKNALHQYAEFLLELANGADIENLHSSSAVGKSPDLKVLLGGLFNEGTLPKLVHKQEFKKVNGFEVKAPETSLPSKGKYYVARPDLPKKYLQTANCQEITDEHYLKMGLVFLNPDDAIAYAKAMCGIDPTTRI
ncbi:MAG: hypothetical protein EBU92_01505 [Betaproteobacteria bacterium]|jgi:hypothetical protein|nr:hypothetical protein [Betaproteobacteria bacterium]